jgi:DNA topoisomerase-1
VYRSSSKNAQEAHEAIRPTSITRTPNRSFPYLNDEQRKLYEMIWKRAIASQMTPAKFDTGRGGLQRRRGPQRASARTGQTMVFPASTRSTTRTRTTPWRRRTSACRLRDGDTVKIEKLYGEQHFTQPPPRYSEASLVKALEQYGIGPPSTYASIISTLQNREYVILDKKRFTPTDVGRVVNKFLTEHFAHWVDYELHRQAGGRARRHLQRQGGVGADAREVLEGFLRAVGEKESVSRKDVTQEAMDEMCPKCGKHQLTIRLGRRGRFIGCTAIPIATTRATSTAPRAPSRAEARARHGSRRRNADPALQGPSALRAAGRDGRRQEAQARLGPEERRAESVTHGVALQLLALAARPGRASGVRQEGRRRDRPLRPYVSHDGQFKSIPL